jgi:CubicO group peptidase (beta-lactamase class C family)
VIDPAQDPARDTGATDAPNPAPLVSLPAQDAATPWPTERWPAGDVGSGARSELQVLVDDVFADRERYGVTYAVAMVQRGRLVLERYENAIPSWSRPDTPVRAGTKLLSWSMAKSMLHAAVGVLVGAGRLVLDAPAEVPEWSDRSDPRHQITLDHLLCMRDGLDFAEDYVDAGVSHVMEMLFGSGRHDMTHFAASRPLAHAPGTYFNYSSGTSNIISGIVARIVGRGPDYDQFLRDSLFDPCRMRTAEPRFDDAGTFVGSSYVYATARDFARFGLLYLRDGVWAGSRVLPEGWVDHGRRARSRDPVDGQLYGAHWWVVGDDLGTFRASGYEGQSIVCCPALDLIVVRMGKSTAEQYPALREWRSAVIDAFRADA